VLDEATSRWVRLVGCAAERTTADTDAPKRAEKVEVGRAYMHNIRKSKSLDSSSCSTGYVVLVML